MSVCLSKLQRSLIDSRQFHACIQLVRSISSFEGVGETVKRAIETKNYHQIPDLLVSLKEPCTNANPFLFLSAYTNRHRTQVIDEILQTFVTVRPRSRPKVVYACLLSFSLQSSHPFPLSLAILQNTLRSGCLPVPQTHLLLSNAWLERRRQSQSVVEILTEMKSIGYSPDTGTCNYLMSSLCAVDHLDEAIKVLREMGMGGCVPDLESYGAVISSMCLARKTDNAVKVVKHMVSKAGISPRQGMVMKVAAALRANREIWKAVEMIEFVEDQGYPLEFESYEIVVEGCLECYEYILAGKVVMKMADRGFIPYIRVRQKVVGGLTSIGEWKLACAIRQRLVELKS